MERVVYTVKEVSEMLGLSKSHVYVLIKRKIIPSLEIGKRRIIPKKQFDDWIQGKES